MEDSPNKLDSDYLLPNHTHRQELERIDVWIYPGCASFQILKHPERIHTELANLKMSSVVRPYDNMLQTTIGYGWESPGYIKTFHAKDRNVNYERLRTFAQNHGIDIYYLHSFEYIEKYKNIYDKEYPVQLIALYSVYDEYLTHRLRHLYYFHHHEMKPGVKQFVIGMGQKLGAGKYIEANQRKFICSILKQYRNEPHNYLPGAYLTWHRGTVNEIKMPF